MLIISEVTTTVLKKQFLDVAREIYRDDPNWVCPLDRQIDEIFDPKKNDYFEHGVAARWIVAGEEGQLLGRIAAFIDHDKKINAAVSAGGVGFFESIDNPEVANLLFDTAKEWLLKHGVNAMDGPINFGENDRFWGLLVDGFTEPSFASNYHLPYYRKLFEQYGFRPYYEMNSNIINLNTPVDKRFAKIWDWVRQKNEITFRHPEKRELDQYAAYFREIYNDAWRYHEEYKPISEARALKLAEEMKLIFIKKMLPFAFVRNEPAGFLVCSPDLNQIFKRFKGKPSIWQLLLFKWRSRNNFLWYRKRGILTRGYALAIGIKPKFQQYGLETGMMMSSIDEVRKLGFESIELRWAGDFNPKINKLHTAVGATLAHKYITYRYLFDNTVEFKRYKPIPMGRGGQQLVKERQEL